MQRLNHANVIDVIYSKYPCVEKYMNDANCIMATPIDACNYILQSAVWRDHIENANTPITNAIKERYKKSLEMYKFILPETITYISYLEKIGQKLESGKPLAKKYELMLIDMAKGLGISVVGRPKRKSQSKSLFDAIQQLIFEKGFKVTATSVLFFDEQVREEFKNFLSVYLQNTCYISKEDLSKNTKIEEIVKLESSLEKVVDDEGNEVVPAKVMMLNNPNIDSAYITELVKDNLSQAFPELYEDSHGEKAEYNDFSVPLGTVSWKDRPTFPKYAQIFILRKEDYLVTNFISAKSGFDDDHDVYGQLVCTSRLARSTGMGKLILLATILMAYQYKVNYVFIQAFLGVTHVQAPLYNRLGFNFNFSNELLKRKTAFYQWETTIDEKEFDKTYKDFLAGRYKPNMRQLKIHHLTFLQPMWLYVRGYETQYACDILKKSGFDYHTKSTWSMGQNLKGKIWDLPLRLLGVNAQDDKMETDEVIVPEVSMRRQDGADCKQDEDCLSDFCASDKKCKPYPYMFNRETYTMRRLDNELRQAGFDINQDKYLYEMRKLAEDELKDKAAELQIEQEDVTRIRKEQDALRAWYEVIQLKKKNGEKVEEESEKFNQRLEEYRKLTQNDRYKYIAKSLLSAGWDSIYAGLFGVYKRLQHY